MIILKANRFLRALLVDVRQYRRCDLQTFPIIRSRRDVSSQPPTTPLPTPLEDVTRLTTELAEHDHLYHNLGTPRVTDAQYDTIRRDLSRLLLLHPHLTDHTSHLTAVGATPVLSTSTAADAYHHKTPMLSLENTFNYQGVRAFVRRLAEAATRSSALLEPATAPPSTPSTSAAVASGGDGSVSSASTSRTVTVGVEPKIDGLSLALRYLDGRLVGAGAHTYTPACIYLPARACCPAQ
jgi:DNA ligase (NAD+)